MLLNIRRTLYCCVSESPNSHLSTPWILFRRPALLADGDDPLVRRHTQGKNFSYIPLARHKELHASVIHTMQRDLL